MKEKMRMIMSITLVLVLFSTTGQVLLEHQASNTASSSLRSTMNDSIQSFEASNTYTTGTNPDLTLTVENYNGVLASTMPGKTWVVLFNSAGTAIATEYVNSKSQVNFYNLQEGYDSYAPTYSVDVYHQPGLALNFQEFWGTQSYRTYTSLLDGYQQNSYAFERNEAILSGISFDSTTVQDGQSFTATVTLYNPNSVSINAKFNIYLSTTEATSTSGLPDESSGAVSVPAQNSYKTTIQFSPSSAGSYHYAINVLSYFGTTFQISDQTLWSSSSLNVTPVNEPVSVQNFQGGTAQYYYPNLYGSGAGEGSVTPQGEFTVPQGDSLTLSASPANGYVFSSWSGDISGSQNPYTFTVNGPITIGVVFTSSTYPVTISSSNGGTVQYSYGTETGSVSAGDQKTLPIPSGDYLSLYAVASTGYVFSDWSGTSSSSGTSYSFVVNGAMSETASFTSNFQATLSQASSNIIAGQSVSFSASVSGGVSPYTYDWYVNGNMALSGTQNSYSYTFSTPGTYTLYVTVTDGSGSTVKSNQVTVTVKPPPLQVTISPQSESVQTGESISFSSSVSGGEPSYSYAWYLNGNQVSNSNSFDYSFSASGTYNVYLVVKDSYGDSTQSSTSTISVSQQPKLEVSISSSSTSGIIGQTFTIMGDATGGTQPYSYQWYLNGNPVSGATGTSYDLSPLKAGTYSIYLEATDNSGTTATSQTIQISVTSGTQTLSVTVEGNSNDAISGATVTLYSSPNKVGEVATASSNSNGLATFSNLAAGTYYVSTSAQGYIENDTSINMPSGSSMSVIIKLNPEIYTVSLTSDTGGNISYSYGTTTSSVSSGQTVKLSLPFGGSLMIQGIPQSGQTFDQWTGIASSSTNPYTLQIKGGGTITATFSPITYTVVFNENGISASLGLKWNVSFNGVEKSSTAPNSIIFQGVTAGTYSFSSSSQYFGIETTSESSPLSVQSDTSVTITFTPINDFVVESYQVISASVYSGMPRNTYPFTVEITYLNLGGSAVNIPSTLGNSLVVQTDPTGNPVYVYAQEISSLSSIAPNEKQFIGYSVTVSWTVAKVMSLTDFLKSTFESLAIDFVGDSLGSAPVQNYIHDNFFSDGTKYAKLWPAVKYLMDHASDWAEKMNSAIELDKIFIGLFALSGAGDFMLCDNVTLIPGSAHSTTPINVTVSAQENKMVLAYADAEAYIGSKAISTGLKEASAAALTACVGVVTCPFAIAASGALLAASVLIGPVTKAVFQKELSDPNPDYTAYATIPEPSYSLTSISNQTVRNLALNTFYYNAYLNASVTSNTRAYYAEQVNQTYYEYMQDELALNYSNKANYYFSLMRSDVNTLLNSMNETGLLNASSFKQGLNLLNNSNEALAVKDFLSNFGLYSYFNLTDLKNQTYQQLNLSSFANMPNPEQNLSLSDQIAIQYTGYEESSAKANRSALLFTENGLPNGEEWQIELGNMVYRSYSSTITVNVTGNFSYGYTAFSSFNYTSPSGYIPTSNGNASFIPVDFQSQKTYDVKFVPTNLPPTAGWIILIDGYAYAGYENISVWIPNGTFDLAVISPVNYTASPQNTTFTVTGQGMSVLINFNKKFQPISVNPDLILYGVAAAVVAVAAIAVIAVIRRRNKG